MLLLLVVSACGSETGDDSAPTTSSTQSTTSTTSSSTTTTTAPSTTTTQGLPDFPPEADSLEHGGDTWVVVLAGSEDINDPSLDKARSDAEDAGYNTGPSDCDFGAAEALGLPEDGHYYTVSVYLGSEADALQAESAFEASGIEGVAALVQTFCLD